MSWTHTPPDQDYIKRNATREPEGERIRKELIDFLERNKIVGIMLDTATHTVEVNIGKLPPKLKTVLSKYGAISVVDETPDWKPGDALSANYTLRNGRPEYVHPERPEGWDDNVVPPMTHPYASAWEQPRLDEIVVDDKTATMSKEAFDLLHEYSSTIPSGVYEGKMWKRHDGSFDRKFLAEGGKPTWQLYWYGYSSIGPGHCSNHHRAIVLTDGVLP